ncbi:hypothetical protein HMPREF0578_2355 [Mobiluncus mulieris 28-1]|nr:hypothetical protein HMPREF0578_2355 [Mobiluncus mulieris 28-1]
MPGSHPTTVLYVKPRLALSQVECQDGGVIGSFAPVSPVFLRASS